MARSVKVHPDKLPQVRRSLEQAGFLTQGQLSAHLEIALSTVSNFLNGKSVYVSTFELISHALDLDKDILILSDSDPEDPEESTADSMLEQSIKQEGSGKNVNIGSGTDIFIGSGQKRSSTTPQDQSSPASENSEILPEHRHKKIKQDISQSGDGRNINIGRGSNIHID